MAFKAASLIHALFGFKGRAKRLDFWLGSVGLAVVRVLALSLGLAWTGLMMGEPESLPLRLGLDLVFLWPSAAIAIKRGHDRNRSALYSGVVLAVLYGAGVALGLLMDVRETGGGTVCVLLLAVGGFYMLIDYGLVDGTKGPNRYGPSPKGIGPTGVGTEVAEVFE